jgi:hypothetical protein
MDFSSVLSFCATSGDFSKGVLHPAKNSRVRMQNQIPAILNSDTDRSLVFSRQGIDMIHIPIVIDDRRRRSIRFSIVGYDLRVPE